MKSPAPDAGGVQPLAAMRQAALAARLLPRGLLTLLLLVLALAGLGGAPLSAQEVELVAPPRAVVGAPLRVRWQLTEGAPQPGDWLAIARPGDALRDSAAHAWTTRNPASLRLPLQPGAWELRYISAPAGEAPQLLASQPLHLDDLAVTLQAPKHVGAGDALTVSHDGPGYGADYLTIAPTTAPDADYLGYAYVGHARQVRILAPLDPGTYELRYVASGDIERVLGRRPLVVGAQPVRLEPVAPAPAGALLQLGWSGPQNEVDYLELARPEAPAGSSPHYAYTRGGSPVRLVAPLQSGAWEIRYIHNADDQPRILARRPLQIQPVTASLQAPAEAVQGSRVQVTWSGPANPGDLLALVRLPGAAPDAAGGPAAAAVDDAGAGAGGSGTDPEPRAQAGPAAEESVATLRLDTPGPLALTLPPAPGRYELRYLLRGDGARVLARQPLRITAAPLWLQAPEQALAGSLLQLDWPGGWQGPANPGDRLALARSGAPDDEVLTSSRLQPGQPARLRLPPEPGDHELRYLAAGRTVLTRRPLQLTPATARLVAPAEGMQGDTLLLHWTGPAQPGDRIGLARPEAPAEALEAFASPAGAAPDAAAGAPGAEPALQPLALELPAQPGRYELRYVSGARPASVLARQSLQVLPARIELQAPAEVGQGARFTLQLSGPLSRAGAVVIARPGSPADEGQVQPGPAPERLAVALQAPTTPGAYELRYTMGSGAETQIVAARPLRVLAQSARLSAADTAMAGSELEVVWQGPGNPEDLIALVSVDELPRGSDGSGAGAGVQRKNGRNGREAGAGVGDAVADEGSDAGPSPAPPAGAGTTETPLADPLARARLRAGAPARLFLPLRAGRYELRYLAGGDPTQVLARRALTLRPPQASLEAPAQAAAGGTLAVDWRGPGASRDQIALMAEGSDEVLARGWVLTGTPLALPLPATPGSYRLAYVSGQGGEVLAQRPLRLEEARQAP